MHDGHVKVGCRRTVIHPSECHDKLSRRAMRVGQWYESVVSLPVTAFCERSILTFPTEGSTRRSRSAFEKRKCRKKLQRRIKRAELRRNTVQYAARRDRRLSRRRCCVASSRQKRKNCDGQPGSLLPAEYAEPRSWNFDPDSRFGCRAGWGCLCSSSRWCSRTDRIDQTSRTSPNQGACSQSRSSSKACAYRVGKLPDIAQIQNQEKQADL